MGELLVSARDGEFDLESLRRRMLGVVRRVLPPWLASQTEDIVHEALIKVWSGEQRRGDVVATSASYYLKAAQNAALDEVRRRIRRSEHQSEDLDELLAESATGAIEGGQEQRVNAQRFDRALRDCLGSLADARRHAVTLHLLGHSRHDAAELLGQGVKATEHLIYRGLSDLRACLTEKGIEP
jgi:RNA polymerase sigma-70 factor (ECF subfamily)